MSRHLTIRNSQLSDKDDELGSPSHNGWSVRGPMEEPAVPHHAVVPVEAFERSDESSGKRLRIQGQVG